MERLVKTIHYVRILGCGVFAILNSVLLSGFTTSNIPAQGANKALKFNGVDNSDKSQNGNLIRKRKKKKIVICYY